VLDVRPPRLEVATPAGTGGKTGTLRLTGGPGAPEGEEPAADGPQAPAPAQPEPGGFDELLQSLQDTPANDDVLATLLLPGETEDEEPVPAAQAKGKAQDVVTGIVSIPYVIRP
jgi:hypothetical protein